MDERRPSSLQRVQRRSKTHSLVVPSNYQSIQESIYHALVLLTSTEVDEDFVMEFRNLYNETWAELGRSPQASWSIVTDTQYGKQGIKMNNSAVEAWQLRYMGRESH